MNEFELSLAKQLPCSIGQKVYVIAKPKTPYMKIKCGSVGEISLDYKGWHMHICCTRYSLGNLNKTVFNTLEEAQSEFDRLKNKSKGDK